MIGVVLISHGKMAEGMLDSARLFFGEDLPAVKAECLLPDDSIDEFDERLKKAVQDVDDGSGTVIFSDLLFGTPCNRSAYLMSENVKVICGANLSVLVEFLGRRSAEGGDGKLPKLNEIDWKEVLEIGRDGLCDLSDKLQL